MLHCNCNLAGKTAYVALQVIELCKVKGPVHTLAPCVCFLYKWNGMGVQLPAKKYRDAARGTNKQIINLGYFCILTFCITSSST